MVLAFNEQYQEQSNWCWAATAVSVADYYAGHRTMRQCELVGVMLWGELGAGAGSSCSHPNGWSDQWLTGGGAGLTVGTAAAGNPSGAQYDNQMHVCYRDQSGLIQDAWFDGSGTWSVQQLNGGGPRGRTAAPIAVGDPTVVQYDNQMHVCYRGQDGLIYDTWYDSSRAWNYQQLNGGAPQGLTTAPPAVGDPTVVQYDNQMHVCYRAQDGLIHVTWFDGSGNWKRQQLNGAGVGPYGLTAGPAAVGEPAIAQYDAQMHVCYRGQDGLIYDTWYDGSGHWNWQQLNGGAPGGRTNAPPTVGDPAIAQYANQMHVCYRDQNGFIQDTWYDGAGSWSSQQLNGREVAPPGDLGPIDTHDRTSGLPADGEPVNVVYDDQMHVCYRNRRTTIEDVFWVPPSCDVSGYLDDALSAVGHLWSTGGGSMAWDGVREEILAEHPIGARIAWTGTGAHFVIIAGYDQTSPGDGTIDVRDPAYGRTVLPITAFPAHYHSGGSWTSTYLTGP